MIGTDRGGGHEEPRDVGEHRDPTGRRCAPPRSLVRRRNAARDRRRRRGARPRPRRAVRRARGRPLRASRPPRRPGLRRAAARSRRDDRRCGRSRGAGRFVARPCPRRRRRGCARTPTTAGRTTRWCASTRRHATTRLAGSYANAGERVGGLDREAVLVDVATGDCAQALGRGHLTPHVAGRVIMRAQPTAARVRARPQPAPARSGAPGRSSTRAPQRTGRRGAPRAAACAARRATSPDTRRRPSASAACAFAVAAGKRDRGRVVGLEPHVGRGSARHRPDAPRREHARGPSNTMR